MYLYTNSRWSLKCTNQVWILQAMGVINCLVCEHGGHSSKFTFYILDVKSPPVVKLDMCEKLDLVRSPSVGSCVAAVNKRPRVAFRNFIKVFILDEFSDNFEGLGYMGDRYSFTLVNDPVPVKHAVHHVKETCQPLRNVSPGHIQLCISQAWVNTLKIHYRSVRPVRSLAGTTRKNRWSHMRYLTMGQDCFRFVSV